MVPIKGFLLILAAGLLFYFFLTLITGSQNNEEPNSEIVLKPISRNTASNEQINYTCKYCI